jgi:IS5 family transposase
MKAHIGVDEHSGLVHHAHRTAANVGDVTQVQHLLHGREEEVHGDSGCTGADNRAELQGVKATFALGQKVILSKLKGS